MAYQGGIVPNKIAPKPATKAVPKNPTPPVAPPSIPQGWKAPARINREWKPYNYLQHNITLPPEGQAPHRDAVPQVMYGKYELSNPNATYEFKAPIAPELGYDKPPSYWEDPRHVAAAYKLIHSLQPGEVAPDWIDPVIIDQAYKYYKFANGTDDWVNWKYLAPSDPGRQFLQSIPLPPLNIAMQPDQYQASLYKELVFQQPAERDPLMYEQLNPSYKYAIQQYDTQIQQDEWNKAHTPGWQNTMQGIMSNPITGGLFQTVPMAAISLGAGPAALPFAAAMLASGVGVGYAQQVRDTHPYLADAIAGASVLLPWGMAIGTTFGPMGTAAGGALALGIGGAAGYLYGQTGFGDYLADTYGWETLRGNRAADAAMALLDAPAEMVERVLGVSIQLDLAKEHPELYGTPEDIWKDLPTAWQAGSMAWESGAIWKMITQTDHEVANGVADTLGGVTANKNTYIMRRLGDNPFNVIPLLNELAIRAGLKGNLEDIKYIDPNQTFIFGFPYPVQIDTVGAAAMTEYRRAVQAGADPYKTMMEYKASFGIPGNTAELVGHMILDPLNRWGEITKWAASGVADVSGQPNLAKTLRMENSTGIFEGLKAHSELVKKFYPMDQLTSWDLRYAGWNSETQGFRIYPAKTGGNPLARIFDPYIFNKTPQTQVMDNIKNDWDFLGSAMSPYRANGDVDGMTNVFHRGVGTPDSAKESASNALLGTLTGIAGQKTREAFAPRADELNTEWHAYDIQRTLKDRLTGALNTSDAELVKRIEASTDDTELVRSMYDELDAIIKNPDADPEQKMLAQDLLVEFNPGEGKLPITGAEQLKQIADAFGKDSEVPKTPDEYLGKLVSAYTEFSAKVLTDALGVTSRPWMMQLTGALKAIQSAALLNLNVGYVVPHAVLNPLTILASGAGGLISIKSSLAPELMKSWWKNFGFEPYRTHAGSGMGGSADVELMGRKGTAAAEKNLRTETQGKGFMAAVERATQKFGKSFAAMPAVAEKMERFQSEVAMYAFTKKTWDALIRHGRNYTPLETNLRASLDGVDPTIVKRIDNAIRNNMDVDGVMKEVFGDELRVDMAGALDELSAKFGTDSRIISETLDAYPGLKERLGEIRRIEDVDPLFTEIYSRMEATNRERLGREVGAKVQEIMTRVGASGQGEAQRIVDQKLQVVEENYMRHMQLMIEAHAEADAIRASGGDVRAFWNAKRAESSRFFATAEANDYAILRGMLEGMDLSKTGSVKYMGDVVKQYEAWQKHYRMIGDSWNEYFRGYDTYTTPQERQIAITELYAKLDENYAKVVSEVANRQTIMDTDFVEMVRLKYGDDTATTAKKWRDSINTFTQDRAKLIQAERSKIRLMTDVEMVRAEWKRFTEQELAPLVRDYHNLDHTGVAEMNSVLTGMGLPVKEGVSTTAETPKKTETAEVKPAEEAPAPEVTRAEFDIADDAGYMITALDYIENSKAQGVLVENVDGEVTRLGNGVPEWYTKYFSNKKSMDYIKVPEYHGKTGTKALKEALGYLVDHGGKPELKSDGVTPYEIFNKIDWIMTKEGSKALMEAASVNPEGALADRDAQYAHLMEVKATVDKVTNRSEIGNKPTDLPEGQANPEFVRWFEGSKVVDENGQPLKVYHGTNAEEFTSFEAGRRGAIWFAETPAHAEANAGKSYQGEEEVFARGSRVLPVYLNMKNPETYKFEGMTKPEVEDVVIAKAKSDGKDGVIFIEQNGRRYYAVFSNDQIKTSFEAEAKPRPMTADELADGEPLKDIPPTLVEDTAGSLSVAEMSSDAWYDTTLPMMRQLQDTIKQRGLVGKGAQLPPDLQQKVGRYINNTIAGDYATAKAAAVGYGTAMRDYSLVNYSDQRGVDNWLSAIIPYQFWATRTAMNWMMRAWDHPAWFANYYRMRKFMMSAQTQSGFPSRLRDTMSIPAPYLPEWAGGNLYFDPLQNIFPFDQFYNGVEMLTQNFNQQEKDAMTVMYGWKNQGTISQAQLTEAVQTKTGDVWNRAMTQAKQDENAGKYNPFEFLQMFLGPALYLTYPYFLATGQKEKISTLPPTRMGQAIEAATADSPLASIGKFIGGALAKPETAFRKAIGISEFGEWGPYYLDRGIADMVADGTCTLQEGLQAMIEKSGPVYEESRKRTMLQIAARVPGAIPTYAALHGGWKNPADIGSSLLFGLYPASILPEGEMIARGLYDEYKAVGERYKNGERNAYNDFFEDHPEYEARLALFDTPEERLRQMMVSEVWDKWSEMGKTEQYEFKDAIGEDFNNYFLNDETRDYAQVDTETLAGWAKIMGGYVPQTEQTAGVLADPDIDAGMLQTASPEVYAEVDTFRQIRSQQFPNYNALGQRYYGLAPGAERKAFLQQFPELKEYWTWSKAYKASHPNVELYITAPTGPQEPQFDTSFMKEVTAPLERQIYAYFYSDKALSTGAIAELNRIWRNSGTGGDFQSFIDVVLKSLYAPTIQ